MFSQSYAETLKELLLTLCRYALLNVMKTFSKRFDNAILKTNSDSFRMNDFVVVCWISVNSALRC